MMYFDVSIEVRKDRVRNSHVLPWVLKSFTVLARNHLQAGQQARVRANLLGLTTKDVFMCTQVEAA